MFEADYEPSTWDNEDGQRRHLAEGDPAPVDKNGKPTAAPAKGDTKKAITPKSTKSANKPVATMTNRRAALIKEYPSCVTNITSSKCPAFVRAYKECELSKAPT
jgi:hypothetical protein